MHEAMIYSKAKIGSKELCDAKIVVVSLSPSVLISAEVVSLPIRDLKSVRTGQMRLSVTYLSGIVDDCCAQWLGRAAIHSLISASSQLSTRQLIAYTQFG